MASFPRAILIDLDDTLLDDSSNVDACWDDACASVAPRLPGVGVDRLRAEIDKLTSWYWSDPKRHRMGRLDLRAVRRHILELVFAELGIDDNGLARDLAETYRELREERAHLFPGAADALDRLRAEGVRLGMMTNGAATTQRMKIERFGLAPYFDHIVIEGEFGVGKPDRRVFDTLLSALDVTPGDAWAIGDHLEFDVLAPMQLGLHGIWVDPRNAGLDGHRDRPDRIVSAFTEIVSSSA
ncbi:MAG: HAD family hydrolase [Chloroflexi bacterium]|nr:HAD family hydrolase [Chloroflexota bacterium]